MTRSIDAVGTSSAITSTYRRYLQSLLSVRDPEIDAALRAEIDSTPMLDRGPFLEATPPYAAGASLKQLIADGVLSPRFGDLTSDALPLDRPLYVHQEQALRKAAAGRNVVVATGTGSGKTESFLLPILDSLVRERDTGTLGPGVRALLLYPMNALANDQMKRLRQLLADFPEITFGRYTGDTQEDPRKARELFGELNIGEPLLPNEIVSRQEMRAAPPNLLLTNFAMLEYLLLRPRDMELFATGSASQWRFLVVDEAHVYDGSQGAEIAMLLRRVRDRVAPERSLQCIATSATVGQDSDPAAVTHFAENLFGQPFEWDPQDTSRQDLVVARRVPAPPGPFWGPLDAAAYQELAASQHDPEAMRAIVAAHGGPTDPTHTPAELLLHEQSLATLRSRLAGGPQTFEAAAAAVFPGDPLAKDALAALVELASGLRLRDGTTLLSARYHLFLRATEGAFSCLSEAGPHVHLARHESCPDCESPAFEIGSCKRCGAVHVVGSPTQEKGVLRLRPRKAGSRGTWLVLGEEALTDEDEEAVEAEEFDLDQEPARLCTGCGAICSEQQTRCNACGSGALRAVRKLRTRGEDVAGCLVCGARGAATVRLFETGGDASSAVIATTLYQQLPPSGDPLDGQRPGEGRKLLAFSDSRQSAAYFAPYLEDSYARVQRRRLLAQGLRKARADLESIAVEDLVFTTRSCATAARHFPGGMTAQQQSRVVAPWVMAEVLATDDRQSLEGLGLLRIGLYRDPAWPAPRPLLDLGLGADEAWHLMEELVRSLRQQGAVTMPEEVPPNDEIFAPRLGPIYARLAGSEPVRKVLSWLPSKGSNRRIDYLTRVLAELGSDADPKAVLEGVWGFLTSPHTPVDWLTSRTTDIGLGAVVRVDHERLRMELTGDRTPVHQCDVCRRTAPVSVRDICPAIGCQGRLRPFVPPAVADDRDHYRSLYDTMHPVPLTAKEHTAQWQNTEAAAIQQQFVRGEINILSCSTTFELGVDVGELQAVLLRNVPPGTANYLQRAGRAGRRAGSAALVVTYAQRRSHDLTRFAEPEVMITGEVRAPYVPLTNERIDRRHAHSVALSAFFRWLFDTTGRIDRQAGEFFLDTDGNPPSADLLESFLSPVPPAIVDSLTRILPPEVAIEIDVAGGAWAGELVRLVRTVQAELRRDVEVLDELRDAAATDQKFSLAQRYQQVGQTLRKRDLLGFLANRNVLPKYGFPVDSVELRTDFGYGKSAGANLDLSRGLSQAIFEYAPGATLVAGGRLWTSRGIYRVPGRDLVEYKYLVCRRCGGFQHGVAAVDQACPHCGEVATGMPRTLTIPEFGFVADREPAKPGPRPPQRSYSGAVHILAAPAEARQRSVPLKGGRIGLSVGPRGRLIAVADGPATMGYWVCEWCGYGDARATSPKAPPKQHKHQLRGNPCKGPQRLLDLGHAYETDLLTIDVDLPGYQGTSEAWKSVLYAVLEAACDALEIARDDIGGSLAPTSAHTWSLVLFDAVSGGAGHVIHVEEQLERVLEVALRRVSNCECGPETSCYGCLRSYGNQRDHDELSRGAAEQILRRLVAGQGSIDPRYSRPASEDLPEGLTAEWEASFTLSSPDERKVLITFAVAGIRPPEVGVESAGGVPMSFAWPDKLVAVDHDLESADITDLEAEGWTVVPAEVATVEKALAT